MRRRLRQLPAQLDNQLETLKDKVKQGEEALLRSPKERKEKGKLSMESAASQSQVAESAEEQQQAPELYKKSSRSAGRLRRRRSDPGAPAAAGDSSDGTSSDEEGDRDEHAFDHPSTYVDQEWIWLPKDRLGFSGMIVGDLRKVGVDASDLGAIMDEKGVVEVTRGPPDNEWAGGNDL